MEERDGSLPSPTAGRYPSTDADLTLRARALESLLVERGLLGSDTIDEIVQIYESDIGPLLGGEGDCPRVGRRRL